MPDNEIQLPVCGAYYWPIHSPIADIVIKFESEGGAAWEFPVSLVGDEERIVALLQERMYPVTSSYRLWIETPHGDRIAGRKTAEPQFSQLEVSGVTHRDPQGRATIWLGDRSALVHSVHLGWRNGEPVYLDVKASIWPPALFCVGNNEVRAFPLTLLAETPLRQLWEELLACAESFSSYEGAHYFMTAADRPAGPPRT